MTTTPGVLEDCCFLCRSCSRVVCRENEVSPGEPRRRCDDCQNDLNRELRDGLQKWGMA